MGEALEQSFQQLCREHNLAVTHQRLVIYRELMKMHDHPNPEQVYERVRPELPSISLATVYKTLHAFVAAGIICQVSPHHGSMRLEPQGERHSHFICLRCHDITDIAAGEPDVEALKAGVPEGYQVEQVSTELRGICGRCATEKVSAGHA
jgi:Fur family peroxide stress response transcriptional regulator